MKLTFKDFINNARATILRFPLVMLVSWCATVLAIYSVHADIEISEQVLPYILSLLFALPLLMAADVFSESNAFDKHRRFGLWAVVALLTVMAYLTYYRDFLDFADSTAGVIRFITYEGIAVLLFLLAPVLGQGKPNRFWQYFVLVLERLILSVVFFGLLFAGIALLLAAVDYLLQIEVPDELYADFWFFIVGGLSLIFFLQGIPDNVAKLERVTQYPKVLKALVQYVSTPLVYGYFVVLYLYTGKIVLTWQWPEGDVAWWIVLFSVLGVATYFFSFATKEKFHAHVDLFRKWYFVILIPQLLLLYLALYWRVDAYGWTEPRYFLGLFGDWLLFISIYFLWSKKKYLKSIPLALLLMLVVAMWGPWSAFNVSLNSQMERLEEGLAEAGMLVDGKVKKVDAESLNREVDANLSSIVDYVVANHGVEHLQPWFDEELPTLGEDLHNVWDLKQEVLDRFGLSGYYGFDPRSGFEFFSTMEEPCLQVCVVDVDGFDRYLPLYLYRDLKGQSAFELAGLNYFWFDEMNLMVQNDDEKPVVVDLKPLYERSKELGQLAPGLAALSFELDEYRAEFRVKQFEVHSADGQVTQLNGDLLIELK